MISTPSMSSRSFKKSNPVLVFDKLSKSFGSHSVLNSVSLEVESNSSLVIIGPSGAGKTVLLKCALELLEVDSGSVSVDGSRLCDLSGAQKERLFQSIGVVFQSSALFDSLTVWENITFSLSQKEKEAKAIALDLLKKVGLSETTADLYPSQLSGGMRRRISLARAMARKPRLLFFDEPITGLDPIAATSISLLIREFITSLKATAITITHDLSSATIIGDEIALLDAGAIAWRGLSSELLTTSDPRVQQFVKGNPNGPLRYAL